jgi:uncharacterized protein (TIGR03067 family)
MKRRQTLMLIMILLWGVSISAAQTSASDKEAMQGRWKTRTLVVSGKSATAKAVSAFTATVQGDILTFWNGAKKGEEVKFILVSGTSPKSIDIFPVTGPRKDQRHPGIYQTDGKTLKLCWALPNKPRPAAFESKKGSDIFLIELERTKP